MKIEGKVRFESIGKNCHQKGNAECKGNKEKTKNVYAHLHSACEKKERSFSSEIVFSIIIIIITTTTATITSIINIVFVDEI